MWDERYDTADYIYGTEPNDFLKENIGVIPHGDVLCLAEGEGRNAVFLAKQGYNVTAVDSSITGLLKAQKLAKQHDVTITTVHADLKQFDIGQNRWDAIISIFCHVSEPLRKVLHRNVVTGLKAHGLFLLEAYTPAQLLLKTGGPPSEALMMSKESLRKELDGLLFSHLVELKRDIKEGTHHSGIGAVAQLIGAHG